MAKAKAQQTEATKAKLQQVARDLFAKRGFAAVSAEELVAKAGVTRGALYHHYDGKEGLFAAVVEDIMRELHAKLAAEAGKEDDPLKALERGIRTFLTISTKPAIQQILLIDGPAVLGWRQWREMDARFGLGLLKRALAGAMSAGRLRHQDVDLLAHALLGALTEVAMVVARAQKPAAAQRAAEQAITAMVAGWR